MVSSIFSKVGHRFGLVKKWTPTGGVEKFPEFQRDRVLSAEELAKVLAAIDAEENEIIRDYFRMLIYTGSVRKGPMWRKWRGRTSASSVRRGQRRGEQFKNGSPCWW